MPKHALRTRRCTGCVPWASGAGALGRQVMGFVVIGGMLAATFIAVFLIPVLFYLVEKFLGKKKQTDEATEPSPAGPGALESVPVPAAS